MKSQSHRSRFTTTRYALQVTVLLTVQIHMAFAIAPKFSEIQLPEGYRPIRVVCENPNTQLLQTIVRHSQTNESELLVNLTTTSPSESECHKFSGGLNVNHAVVLNGSTGSIIAQLYSPQVDGHATSSNVYSASTDLQYAVGNTVYKTNDWAQSTPILWQRTSASEVADGCSV